MSNFKYLVFGCSLNDDKTVVATSRSSCKEGDLFSVVDEVTGEIVMYSVINSIFEDMDGRTADFIADITCGFEPVHKLYRLEDMEASENAD